MTDTEKAEYESVIQKLTTALEQLAAENASLKANNASAHQTLRAIYADSSQPATVRVRAAQAAIGHESAPLKSVEPPLELVAQEYKPLSQLVEEQRKRCDAYLALSLEERSRLITGVGNDGNGSDSDHS